MEDDELLEENLDATNEIIEITDEDEMQDEPVYDTVENEEKPNEEKKKEKKNKKPLKEKWNELSKKNKIIIISCASALLLLIIGLLLYFLVFKKDNKKEEPDEPEVILEKGNYRYENGILIFLDKNKKELGKYECKNKDENKCKVATYSGEDDFDVVKRVYEDNKGIEEGSDIYNDNFVFITDNADKQNNIILFDIAKQEEVGNYTLIKKIDDENVIVKNDEEKYGTLKIGKEVSENIKFSYDYLGKISEHDNLVAMTNNNSKLIDVDGKALSKDVKGNIKNYNEKYISYENNDDYALYDYNGKKVLTRNIDFITFNDSYVVLVDNEKVYAYDENLNLLNYEGVKLSSGNFVKKIVYNEDLKEIERQDAFSVEVGSNTVIIKDGDNQKEINIYEGKLSNNYKYVSYYDGTIYIFKDEAKNNLLGTYTCKNKNDITKNSTMFEKCFIASETKLLNRSNGAQNLGFAPVINDRFVFINDVDSAKNSNAMLYDLTNKKTMSGTENYVQVDVGYYNKDFGFVNSASVLVMAKNNDGNFGIINVGKENASRFITFTDEKYGATKEIKYVGNDFLVKRENMYVLYDSSAKEIGHASNEITSYNSSALLLKNNNMYTVTTKDGKIMKSNLVYAKLYDGFFVGITSDKIIDIYRYTDGGKEDSGVLRDEEGNRITITISDYASSYEILNGNQITIIGGSTYSINTGMMAQ